MNFNTESKVAELDAQQPGGGSNLSASTTRTPVTGVAIPPVSRGRSKCYCERGEDEDNQGCRNAPGVGADDEGGRSTPRGG